VVLSDFREQSDDPAFHPSDKKLKLLFSAQKLLEDQLAPSHQRLDEQALVHDKNPLPIDEPGPGLFPSLVAFRLLGL
jgi:hypothetical protein